MYGLWRTSLGRWWCQTTFGPDWGCLSSSTAGRWWKGSGGSLSVWCVPKCGQLSIWVTRRLGSTAGDKVKAIWQHLDKTVILSPCLGEIAGVHLSPWKLTSTVLPEFNQTVRNRLHDNGMRARRPVTGPILTAEHRTAWLNLAHEHQNWQVRHWRPVLN